MNEDQYFEQFVGDENEMIFYYIPMSLKDFESLSEFEKKLRLAIAQSLSIPMSVWLGQSK